VEGLLQHIGISVVSATLLGIAAYKVRQPVILGYLVAGAIVGPEVGVGWVSDPHSIETISEIGLILLLFIIGLELDLKQIAAAGRKLFVVGIGQFLCCVLLGLGAFALAGYGLSATDMGALYLALACALSSTALVAKILYDKSECDTLPGRMTLGILVVQDMWAILVLSLQPNFADPRIAALGKAIGASLLLLLGGFLASKYLLRRVYGWVSASPEMVLAVSLGWCMAVAGAAGLLGVSMEMGALIAGLSISTFPYSKHVTEKCLPLRDFFLTLFFVSLGMKIVAPEPAMLLATALIVLFVVATRFATIYPLLALMRSGRRTCFITSLNLSQISEFSLVVVSLGVSYGHVGADLMALVIYAMATSCILSSYAMKYNHQIFRLFDRRRASGEGAPAGEEEPGQATLHFYPVVLLGFHRGAQALVEALSRRDPRLLKKIQVLDFNSELMPELARLGVAGAIVDISSPEALVHGGVEFARVIVSTIPDSLLRGTSNRRLVEECRALAPHAFLVATAERPEQVESLREAGADDVVLPFGLLGERLADLLEETQRGHRI
jgi:Kef-type K+ transport system membrane component KefB